MSQNIPAMDWREVPDFYATLTDQTPTHLGLRLLILTGLRSRPIRFAYVDELEGDTWTIPAETMKGRKGATSSFRVPLSDEAQRVIELAQPLAREGYLFPSERKGVISDATMSRHMERRGLEARPHGFRTSLRTWLAKATDAPHEVAEMMIAHQSGSSVVRTYRRTDYLDARRALHERWAQHCLGRNGSIVRLAEHRHA